jgi:hypothetical protein
MGTIVPIAKLVAERTQRSTQSSRSAVIDFALLGMSAGKMLSFARGPQVESGQEFVSRVHSRAATGFEAGTKVDAD